MAVGVVVGRNIPTPRIVAPLAGLVAVVFGFALGSAVFRIPMRDAAPMMGAFVGVMLGIIFKRRRQATDRHEP